MEVNRMRPECTTLTEPPGFLPWAIVLAGGEGERMKPAISRWLGEERPKQYCTFTGTRSMLEHTWDRCRQITLSSRIVSVIGSGHSRFLNRLRQEATPGTVIEQPEARGTLAGVLFPLAYVLTEDPAATVCILPSDHFIFPENRFLGFLRDASTLANLNPDRIVVLGAVPDSPETDYGWIQGEVPKDRETECRKIVAFAEKPPASLARKLFKKGGFWNTMILTAKARHIWNLATSLYPEMMQKFDALRTVISVVRQKRAPTSMESIALSHTYRSISSSDLSRDLLQQLPEQLLLLPLVGVEWSDWGRPFRIRQTLEHLGKKPGFVW